MDPYTTGNGHGRTLGAEQPKALSSKTQNVKAVAALPVEKKQRTVVREMRQMPMHGVYFATGPALMLGLQPRVPVFSAET